jgi:hypothetical protein
MMLYGKMAHREPKSSYAIATAETAGLEEPFAPQARGHCGLAPSARAIGTHAAARARAEPKERRSGDARQVQIIPNTTLPSANPICPTGFARNHRPQRRDL